MYKKAIGIFVLLSVLSGCRSKKTLTGDHPQELVGTWQLLIRSSCDQYGVTSDTLILHADGTFEQQVTTKDGKRVGVTAQRWKYNELGGSRHIALDKRLEFFTPELTGSRMGTFEVLLVELDSEPVILLHPDSDCVYGKIQDPSRQVGRRVPSLRSG